MRDAFFRISLKFKKQCLFEIEILCNIMNVTFVQFNASLLNNSINFFKKKKILLIKHLNSIWINMQYVTIYTFILQYYYTTVTCKSWWPVIILKYGYFGPILCKMSLKITAHVTLISFFLFAYCKNGMSSTVVCYFEHTKGYSSECMCGKSI